MDEFALYNLVKGIGMACAMHQSMSMRGRGSSRRNNHYACRGNWRGYCGSGGRGSRGRGQFAHQQGRGRGQGGNHVNRNNQSHNENESTVKKSDNLNDPGQNANVNSNGRVWPTRSERSAFKRSANDLNVTETSGSSKQTFRHSPDGTECLTINEAMDECNQVMENMAINQPKQYD